MDGKIEFFPPRFDLQLQESSVTQRISYFLPVTQAEQMVLGSEHYASLHLSLLEDNCCRHV